MYPIFTNNKSIETERIVYVQSIEEAYTKENFTKMFWFIPNTIQVDDAFKFDYDPNAWDIDRVHVFKNKHYHDGILLVPRSVQVSTKCLQNYEFNKPVYLDTNASSPIYYDAFTITNYNDYLEAAKLSKTELFWIMKKGVSVPIDFKFSCYFPGSGNSNLKCNHRFTFNNTEVDVILASKHSILSLEEINDFTKIQCNVYDTLGSKFIDKSYRYDVVFISYQEPNADENYNRLLEKVPYAKRIHGVKGIHQAHIEAAKLCTTDMIWIIDGDAIVSDNFDFNFVLDHWPLDTVYVWRSKNPINDLEYGYGGIKLLPRKYTLEVDTNQPDMTTSIGNTLQPVFEFSNVTSFNTDPFNTWKSAFRECVKLSSKTIKGQINEDTEHRLHIWQTVGKERSYGEWAIRGAQEGAAYGRANQDNTEKLKKINDFDWLHAKFSEHTLG